MDAAKNGHLMISRAQECHRRLALLIERRTMFVRELAQLREIRRAVAHAEANLALRRRSGLTSSSRRGRVR